MVHLNGRATPANGGIDCPQKHLEKSEIMEIEKKKYKFKTINYGDLLFFGMKQRQQQQKLPERQTAIYSVVCIYNVNLSACKA